MAETLQTTEASYEYLKCWLSAREIREIRENNPLGIRLGRHQVLNIMKRRSKNFPFLNLLIAAAKKNEEMSKVST